MASVNRLGFNGSQNVSAISGLGLDSFNKTKSLEIKFLNAEKVVFGSGYNVNFNIRSQNLLNKNAIIVLRNKDDRFIRRKFIKIESNNFRSSIFFDNYNPFELASEMFELEIMCDDLLEESNSFVIYKELEEKSIVVNNIKYNYEIVNEKVTNIKKKIKSLKIVLNDEENLILNLPLIQWNLGYFFGSVIILHWLEGSRKSIELDYDFFLSEERVNNIDLINLENYFKNIQYLSASNLGYYPSNPDGLNLFLFNDDIGAVRKSLAKFNDFLNSISTNTSIGDFNNLSTHIDDVIVVKNNLFQSFSIGSAVGNFDDIGVSLGRYSYRVYFKGFLNKNTNLNKWVLNIESIGGRFVDEFSFNDESFSLFSSSTWKSQSLGCWINNIDNSEVSRLKNPFSDKICLENEDFISLRNKCARSNFRIGGDYIIFSKIKEIKNEFIKKSILIH
jgi:hypothetical protein